MITDVATFIGAYPYRHVDGGTPEGVLSNMDRLGVDRAWVAHLPSILYKDPAPGTVALLRVLEPHRERLLPVPTIHPGLPHWERDLDAASREGAPAVRAYPTWQGIEPAGDAMRHLVAAAAARRLPVHLAVRMEDIRQRHPLDTAAELPAAAVRALARHDEGARLVISNADRAFVEEVHFGLTPAEARRVVWDVAWLWGPPEDHLRHVLATVGVERFVLGTGAPLRLPDGPFAQLDLANLTADDRARVLGRNLADWT